MNKIFPLIILISIVQISCAPVLSKDLMNKAIFNVRFSEIKKNPNFYKEKLFILGGMIIETKATEKGSSIETLYVPVDWRGQLLSINSTTDRYLAIYPKDRGYLDSLVFRKKRTITIAGKFIELQTGTIEKMGYIYPVFEIKELHLWEDWRTDVHSDKTLFDLEKAWKMDYATSQSFHTPTDNNDQTINNISGKSSVFDRDDSKGQTVPTVEEVQTKDTAMHELSESEQQQPFNKIEAVEEIKESRKLQEQEQVANQRQTLTEEAKKQDVKEKQSEPFIDNTETDKLSTHELTKSEQIKEVAERTEKLKKKEEVPDLKQSLAKKVSTGGNEYYVQVGTWKNQNYAQKMLEKIKNYYPKAFIVEHNNFNKIRIPDVLTKKQGVIVSKDIEEKFNMKPLLVLKIQ